MKLLCQAITTKGADEDFATPDLNLLLVLAGYEEQTGRHLMTAYGQRLPSVVHHSGVPYARATLVCNASDPSIHVDF